MLLFFKNNAKISCLASKMRWVTGYAEEIAWAADVVCSDQTPPNLNKDNFANFLDLMKMMMRKDEKFEMVNLTPAGVFG